MLKGLLYWVATTLAMYLLLVFLEYFGRFETTVRTVFFFSFVLITIFQIGYFIVYPFLQLKKMGPIISHLDAAKIIGTHFPSVKDKLINVLELKNSSTMDQTDLVAAAIDQKAASLSPIPFSSAVDYSSNKPLLKYSLPTILVFILLLFLQPNLITGSTERLVKYDQHFEVPAPFSFSLDASTPKAVIEGSNVSLLIHVTGEEYPDQAYIQVNNHQFKLAKKNKNTFSFELENLRENTNIRFSADGFNSIPYLIKVYPKPIVSGFDAFLIYPNYLGKKNEKISNAGELEVPIGTQITWNISSQNVEKIGFLLDQKVYPLIVEGRFTSIKKTIMQPTRYGIFGSNKFVRSSDTMSYQISVIPDQYPVISSQMIVDSNQSNLRYFGGSLSDDHGITKLLFHYEKQISGKKTASLSQKIPTNNQLQQGFNYAIDLRSLKLEPGEEIQFWFEVFDNDGVTGPKSTKSSSITYKEPTESEAEKQEDKNNSEINQKLNDALKEIKKIRKETEKISQKLLDKKELSFDDQKKLKELLQRQQQISKNIQEAQKLNEENKKDQMRPNDPISEDVLEKQRVVEELFNQVINDELKKMMDELKKLMQQENKDKFNEDVKKFNLDNKELEKELDKMANMLKQAQLEEKLQQTASEIEKLAEQQEKLAEQSENKNAKPNDLKKQQDALNQKFNDLDKKLQSLEEENKKLEDPKDLGDLNEESKDIQSDQEESSNQLQKGNKKSASEKQKEAANQMKRMANRMKDSMDQDQEEQLEEDMKALRALMENLVKYSFNQEKLMDDLTKNPNYNNTYVRIGQNQRKLKDDVKLIEDSLTALSKRAPQVSSYINKEMSGLTLNLDRSLKALSERNTYDAKTNQQYAMMHANNLAVMLAESFKEMQQDMQESQKKKQEKQQKGGGGACKKPGQGKPGGKGQGMGNMKQMQEQLNKQLQQMREQQKNGQKPGGQKPGGKEGQKPGSSGSGGTGGIPSSEFAKAVARQEAIRRELQKMSEQLKKEGKSGLGDLDKLAKEMEKTEEELVNKRLTPETMKRQQDIFTKLLEAEKAEREREQDTKRESKSAQDVPAVPPAALEEYRRKREKELEMYRTLPPEYAPFFKQKVEDYFKKINGQ
jgi:hypothetical protein